ncbi:Rossmann-fold NAD(P)-binding domain-containing protein [Kaistella palustris]|uniref:hypothetical protein n=1 Tax=Kaistella palustris TaxID=493376 RepID=UPI000413AA8C|nr:hypothetical protein [Kaistella palustris]
MNIAIIGCGWLGQRVAAYLTEKNHHVLATTTSREKIPTLEKVAGEVHLLDFNKTENFSFLNESEMAIFSMPVSRNSWHSGFARLQLSFPKTLFFSSTGIYPQDPGIYTEDFLQNLRPDILASETLVKEKYPQTTVLRFGGLMGDERSPQNFFKHKAPANPGKKVNYIHYEDIVAITELLLTEEKGAEIYNIVAPEHPSLGEILQVTVTDFKNDKSAPDQRIISPQHFIQDFSYKFIHPNPKYF